MDNTLAITLQTQTVLRRQMDVAANNMANVSTPGYKAESMLFEPVIRRPARTDERPTTVAFVRDYTIARDFRPGALQRTDNPLDLALTGEGFFTVQTQAGPAYTRDGRFALDPNGRLVNNDGLPVLDDQGQPITLDLANGEPVIGRDGMVRQNGNDVGRLGLATFARPGALDKIGDNLLVATGEAPAQALNAQVVQGMVEGSNVVAVRELTSIMEISRAYESASRLQRNAEDLRKTAIERLGRTQG
jgi:flagellar basal-body rod protein FlgF